MERAFNMKLKKNFIVFTGQNGKLSKGETKVYSFSLSFSGQNGKKIGV